MLHEPWHYLSLGDSIFTKVLHGTLDRWLEGPQIGRQYCNDHSGCGMQIQKGFVLLSLCHPSPVEVMCDVAHM